MAMTLIGSFWFTIMLAVNFGVCIYTLMGFMKNLDSYVLKGYPAINDQSQMTYRYNYIIRIVFVILGLIALCASGMAIEYFAV